MKPLVLNMSTPFSERSLPIQVFSLSGSTSPKRSIAIEPTSSSCSCSACQNLSVLNGISLFSILLMTFGYEKVDYVGLDPEGASASGINVSLLNLALSFTTALVIVSSKSAVGVILVIALLSTPTLLGLNKAHSLRIAMMRSSFFGLCISLLGFILSIVFNLSPGPAISVICVASLMIPKLRK